MGNDRKIFILIKTDKIVFVNNGKTELAALKLKGVMKC